MSKKSYAVVAIVAIIVAVLFVITPTRVFMIWLLPLGSGTDDAIVLGALIIAGIFGAFAIIRKKRSKL